MKDAGRSSAAFSAVLAFIAAALLALGVLVVLVMTDFSGVTDGSVPGPETPLPASAVKDSRHGPDGAVEPDAASGETRSASREAVLSRRKAEEAAALEGPAVSGVVKDAVTGEPPDIGLFGLELWEADRATGAVRNMNLSQWAYNDDGSFVVPLRGVPVREDASYALICDLSSYVICYLEGLVIPPDKGLSGLVLALQPHGRLHLVGSGYRGNGIRSLQVELTCRHRPAREVFWRHRPFGREWEGEYGIVTTRTRGHVDASPKNADGIWNQTVDLDPGLWEVKASMGGQKLETTVTIEPGRTTQLVIDREDIGPAFTILGSLKYSSGDPIPGARVRFLPSAVSGWVVEPDSCKTDADGEFKPLDLLPGVWEMTAWLENGDTHTFPRIVIPDSPTDPYRLDLVVHGGTVSGTLCDRSTNLPFGDDYTRWFLLLRDTGGGKVAAELGNHFGSDFRITGVPPGEMRLEVRARGFVDFVSRPFRLQADRDLDLGDLCITRQDRKGSLILAVTDEQGGPFKETVSIKVLKPLGRDGLFETLPCNDRGYSWSYLGGNMFRFDRLPAQKLVLSISPWDRRTEYKSRKVEVEVKSGEVIDVAVALSKD